eukprot:760339-Pelagomonas_calceolata.AAC.1
MEPAQERFHVYEKKEERKGIPLNGAPSYEDVFCIMAVRKAYSGVCLLVEVFDGVNGNGEEAKVIHDPEQFVVVCSIEGRGKVYNQCIHISIEEYGIFKSHDY